MSEVESRATVLCSRSRLNRPDVLNALNRAVHAGIAAGLEEAKDPAVRAVVITGAGRGFCVGQDLQEFSPGAGDVAQNLRDNYHRNVLAIRALEKPVIAAVNGAAAGAGLSLALACDARIAADSASFVPAFIKIGLVPDSGGTWLVRRLLGAARAFEWLTTGRRVDAEEARAWGLVNEVVPADELPSARTGGRGALRRDADPRRVAHEAPARRRRGHELRAAARARGEDAGGADEDARLHGGRRRVPREARGARSPVPTSSWPHPVRLVVNDDLQRWRLTVALRWLLALAASARAQRVDVPRRSRS